MQTNMTKLTVTFHNFASVLKHISHTNRHVPYVHYEVFFGPDNNHSDLRALNGLLLKQQQG